MRVVYLKSLFLFVLLCGVAESEEKNELKVVFTGFGRSGTTSLSAALARLGFNTVHGHNIIPNILGSHYDMAQAIIDNDVAKLVEVTENMGYNATLDMHASFWKEIRKLRPNAKYVIIIRSVEKWEASMSKVSDWTWGPLKRYPLKFIPPIYRFNQLILGAVRSRAVSSTEEEILKHFHNPSTPEAIAKKKNTYKRFVAEVTKFAEEDPEHALIFNLKDGYPVLCEFLNVDEEDCPKEDFPWLNSGNLYDIGGYVLRIIEVIIYAIGVFLLYLFSRCFTRRKSKHD